LTITFIEVRDIGSYDQKLWMTTRQ
jgi:hypothetical protein